MNLPATPPATPPAATPPAPASAPAVLPPTPPSGDNKEVQINGQTFVLPAAEAERLIAARDGMVNSFNSVNTERQTLEQQLAQIETDKLAAIANDKKKKAEDDGSLDDLKQIHAQELQAQKDLLAKSTRDNGLIRLRNIVSVRSDIPETMRGDAAALIEASVAEIIDSGGQTHFKLHDGKLIESSQHVTEWLEQHQGFKGVQIPAGTGTVPGPDAGGSPLPANKPTMKISEYNKRCGLEPDLVMQVTKDEVRLIPG